MAQRIMIEIADDGATSVSVEADGAEPQMMDFASPAEAIDALAGMVGAEENPEAMWEQEAAAREAPMMEEMV
jgi:hypothetical protein